MDHPRAPFVVAVAGLTAATLAFEGVHLETVACATPQYSCTPSKLPSEREPHVEIVSTSTASEIGPPIAVVTSASSSFAYPLDAFLAEHPLTLKRFQLGGTSDAA